MKTIPQPFRYAFVSACCLVLHNVVIIAADYAGWPLALAVLVSFCLSAATGYVLHSLLTFAEPMGMSGLARYVAAVSLNIPLAYLSIWLWHQAIGLPMVWASPIASLCLAAINYVLAKWAIVRPLGRLV